MQISPDNFRRWLGAGFLTVAVALLVLGLTVLESRLKGVKYMFYWVACFGFTGLAAATALLDLVIVRWQSREAQRRLIEKTVEELKKAKLRREAEENGAG